MELRGYVCKNIVGSFTVAADFEKSAARNGWNMDHIYNNNEHGIPS
jgi:hypothetical protein